MRLALAAALLIAAAPALADSALIERFLNGAARSAWASGIIDG